MSIISRKRKCPGILMKPIKRTRNTGIPASFPKYSKNSLMFAMYGSPQYLMCVLRKFERDQHTFFKTKNFKYSMMQGEFSGGKDPHIQGLIQAHRGKKITTTCIYKAMAPEDASKLQITKKGIKSMPDALHYCSKPHNLCDCDHCEKQRKCLPNWYKCVEAGIRPKGQGKGRFDAFIEEMKVNAHKSNMMNQFPELVIRYPAGMKAIQQHHLRQQHHRRQRAPVFPKLHDWERNIDIQLFLWDPRDRRCIVWIWSKALSTGKTMGMKHIKYFYGTQNCKKGGKSLKHFLYSYDGESLIHFNYTVRKPYNDDDIEMLEELSDGGLMCPDHYDCPTRNVCAHIFVTANVPPPEEWRGPNGRLRMEICLDPKKTKNTNEVVQLPMQYDKKTPSFGTGLTDLEQLEGFCQDSREFLKHS